MKGGAKSNFSRTVRYMRDGEPPQTRETLPLDSTALLDWDCRTPTTMTARCVFTRWSELLRAKRLDTQT
jgi:hypothetical protein